MKYYYKLALTFDSFESEDTFYEFYFTEEDAQKKADEIQEEYQKYNVTFSYEITLIGFEEMKSIITVKQFEELFNTYVSGN